MKTYDFSSDQKNYYNLSSDKFDIFIMILDISGSMQSDSERVREGIRTFKKSFQDFSDINAISVSISKFDEDFYEGEFKHINDLDTSYYANGGTAMYDAIVEGAEYLNAYVAEVIKRTKVNPKVTFILFTDGDTNSDRIADFVDAQKTIRSLNYAKVSTVFVAFGGAITSEVGASLGFQSTLDVKDRSSLVNFLGVELSQSVKEQSKSAKALGENFFSKATDKENSEGYSQTTAQALEDDTWMSEDIF